MVHRMYSRFLATLLIISANVLPGEAVLAQTAPSPTEAAGYTGLHAAAHTGNLDALRSLIAAGADLEARDARDKAKAEIPELAKKIAERLLNRSVN